MIDKEQIQQRRHEIAELRHADSVYRDIIARENERTDYEKRWFWELLQNAKDSVTENQTLKVKIEINENQISFSHTGDPFELDDILSLIIQGSSKNNKDGKTGRFGTGFMTTYLLSKEVHIQGKLNDNQGCFDFLLNRNAQNNDQFFELQKDSNKAFDDSIRDESYLLDEEFQTRFTYALGEEGSATAKIGLQCIDELIPITQLFNEQIQSVNVIENGVTKTFSKSLIKNHSDIFIEEWEITTLIEDAVTSSLKAYIYKDKTFDACIITEIRNNEEYIYPLTTNYPRLYYTFPLIGTEEIGIPIIINSTYFDPRVERDGIYLKKIVEGANEDKNKEIINDALCISLQAFATLCKSKNIAGIFELFDFQKSKDLKWMDQDWFTTIKLQAFDTLAAKEIIRYEHKHASYTSLNDLIIPFTSKEEWTLELWLLLSTITDKRVPLSNELSNWINIASSISTLKTEADIYHLKYIWGIHELIKFVERKSCLEELETLIENDCKLWLNNFYSLIIKIKGHFPLDIKVCLNQRNNLRIAEGISWDNSLDDELISISDLIGANFADRLFDRDIKYLQINGTEKFGTQDAVNFLKSNLNDLEGPAFENKSNQQAIGRFLKWLIANDHQEIIKDLKVLRGMNNKSEETPIYEQFSKTEHLLLAPKSTFHTDFPLYSNLIRDKDCMNEIYSNYLEANDYDYLSKFGFIYLKPLIIRTENASIRTLENLVVHDKDLNLLRDSEGQLKYKFEITYSDFAYLTTNDGHIYGRNTTQKSSLERLRFFLTEAVEKDPLFDSDLGEITIEGMENPIAIKKCFWVARAKKLNWVNVKTENENSEAKFLSETPSSKNFSELLKLDDSLTKTIRGSKQQSLLNKLEVGVSDLIRNTLSSDELRLSWDKAITNMITSDADPELVQEIFNDPNIRKEYEKRLNERKLIDRNQNIGKLIESLFKEYILQLKSTGIDVNIERKPFGSDYILTNDSSDLVNTSNQREGFQINNWLVELKATKQEYASMTPLQAKISTEQKDNYSLVVVPLNGQETDIHYLRKHARVITDIGNKIEGVFGDFTDVQLKKNILLNGQDGISVDIEDENVRFRVSSKIWNSEHTDIETFIKQKFGM
jgi:hypothetical protein